MENDVGLLLTIYSMNGRASIADPSTTSIMKSPLIWAAHGSSGWFAFINSTHFVAIDPPIECPTNTIDYEEYFSATCFIILIVSSIRFATVSSFSLSQ